MTNLSIRSSIRTAVVAAAVVLASAGLARAENRSGGSAPKASDVAMLRGLLSLQYPALRHGGSPAVTPNPSVTVEPERRDVKLPEIEGGVPAAPVSRPAAI